MVFDMGTPLNSSPPHNKPHTYTHLYKILILQRRIILTINLHQNKINQKGVTLQPTFTSRYFSKILAAFVQFKISVLRLSDSF